MGHMELILIAIVVVLLFGGAQLPKLAKSLGGFMSEFNAAKEDAEESIRNRKTAKKEAKTKSAKNKKSVKK